MLKTAKFYEVFFSKAKDLGYSFIHTDTGFRVVYPVYGVRYVHTDKEFQELVAEILKEQ